MQEIVSKRTRNSKHYDIGNGRIKAVIHSGDIHYPDSNNVFQDIETNIEYESGFGHKIKKANHNIRFFERKLRYGFEKGVYIDYSLPSADYTVEGNTCLFQDAWSNTDLKYQVMLNGIKADIILKNNTAPTVFEFPVDLKKCTFTLVDNRIDIFSDDDRLVGNIPAPFTVDAEGNRGDVSLSYTDNKVVLSVDSEWIETAVYPVVVDPTTTINVTNSNNDGMGNSGYYSTTSGFLKVGNDLGLSSFYVRFVGVDIPQAATIDSAVVTFHPYYSNYNTPTRIYFCAEDDAAYPNTYSAYTSKPLTTNYVDFSFPLMDASNPQIEHSTSNLKSVVQEVVNRVGWASGNAMVAMFTYVSTSSGDATLLHSYDGNASYAPTLEVTYTEGSTSDDETVTAPMAEATATGLSTTTSLTNNIGISVPIGTSTATGLSSTTTVSNTVSITVPMGEATAEGLTPSTSITNNLIINAPMAIATAEGIESTTSNFTIQSLSAPLIGTATAEGLTPMVLNTIPIATATAEGLATTSSINHTLNITLPIGEATAEGLATNTYGETNNIEFMAPIGQATAEGLESTVSNITTQAVETALGEATSEGLQSTTSNRTTQNVIVPLGEAIASGLASTTVNNTAIAVSADIGTATAEGLSINAINDISVTVPMAEATSEGLPPTTANVTIIIISPAIGTALAGGFRPLVNDGTAVKKRKNKVVVGLNLEPVTIYKI